MVRQSASQRGYDATWRKLRRTQLAQEPLCRYCTQQGYTVTAEVVDHIAPVRERPDLRLDPDNLQSLCKECHDKIKTPEDQGHVQQGADATGMPLSGAHHWNTDG
jgi:5-methylcytosine-specific restriction protein A